MTRPRTPPPHLPATAGPVNAGSATAGSAIAGPAASVGSTIDNSTPATPATADEVNA
ncbi:hypothetical protein [Streptodolium elevatio]|uniref:Uncharacterized protein n=1 Tax=Streptodolium elevatio TaxID=3157996 RepID=A0ABV3DVK0_9ACTN